MVTGPLLASKYRVPPRRPATVARARLVEALGAVPREALTLVSAPAGFGKTTLLTEWLAAAAPGGVAAAWVSLDRRDDDPRLFWTYVVTAIRAAADGLGDGALQQLAGTPSSTDAALVALLNDLATLPRDLVLVLDDLHLVEATAVHDGLAFLLEHRPPQLHLVLATRVDPPLPLARLRARGDLLEVRAADLRFTAEEAAAYLNGPMGLALSARDVVTLGGRTEGWVAALQLAALSLQGRDDPSGFIAGFAGDDRHVVDYLAEEVLGRQPADVRDFLLETSILERLCGPLCDAVTGRGDGRAALVALERANLFLVPLDDRREWYRYHHLFADVLRSHLVHERGGGVGGLHRRASTWFEAGGDVGEAVRHALAAGDVDRAAGLMERAMTAMRRARREGELAGWVRALPEEVVAVRPVLAVAFVGVLAQVGAFETVEKRLDDLDRTLRPDGGGWPTEPAPGLVVVDEPGWASVPADVELYRAALALSRGDVDGTVTHAREALSLVPPGNDLTRAAAGALLGLASWTRGELAAAHAAYTESVAGLRRAGHLADVLGCCITLGDLRRAQGRLAEAEQTYRWALDLAAEATPPLRGTADMHVGLAGVLLERDDRAGAAACLAAAERLGERGGLPQNPYRSRVTAARLRAAEGDLDAALALLDEADRVYDGDYSPNVAPVPAVRARLRLRRGELRAAEAWARERGLSADDEPSYLREYEHLTVARILLARHRAAPDGAALDQATRLLDRLRAAAEAGERDAAVVEALVLQALVRHARGDARAALAALHRAVTLAEPAGLVRVFADEGAPMAALLTALRRTGDAPAVRRLLAATAPTGADPHRRGELVDPLTERELDVLRLLASDLAGPEMARALFVSLNTLRTHTKNVYAKLGVNSRRAAVRRARELDLLRR